MLTCTVNWWNHCQSLIEILPEPLTLVLHARQVVALVFAVEFFDLVDVTVDNAFVAADAAVDVFHGHAAVHVKSLVVVYFLKDLVVLLAVVLRVLAMKVARVHI